MYLSGLLVTIHLSMHLYICLAVYLPMHMHAYTQTDMVDYTMVIEGLKGNPTIILQADLYLRS